MLFFGANIHFHFRRTKCLPFRTLAVFCPNNNTNFRAMAMKRYNIQ